MWVLVGTALTASVLVLAIGLRSAPHPAAPSESRPLSAARALIQHSPSQPRQLASRQTTRSTRPAAQARRFLDASLAYEARPPTSRARRELAATTGGSLLRYLSGAPRRLGARPRARVLSLRLFRSVRGEIKASAIVRRRSELSLFEFLLTRSAMGWRVTEVYP